ncbi:MAG: TadE/TadG family type IV pilus assembly protein [Candidatus Nanopelagicales bacterium]
MRNTIHRRQSERGSTILEFALAFTIFLAFVLGGFEMGRAIWTYSTLSHAAKQAVRYAMIHGADNTGVDQNGNVLGQSDVDTVVEGIARDNAVGLESQLVLVETTWTPNNTPGSTVEVRVTYPFRFLFTALTSTSGSMALATEYSMIVTN